MSTPVKVLLGLAALAAVAFSASLKLELTERSAREMFAFREGETLPDFELESFEGGTHTLYDELERYDLVAINYWATWCGPCKLELPSFIRDYEGLAPDGHFQILAVTSEPTEDLEPFLAELPLPFPVLLDPDGELGSTHGVRALPTTVIVGEGGEILSVRPGIFPGIGSWVRRHLDLPREGSR